jgi:hypothetical protein
MYGFHNFASSSQVEFTVVPQSVTTSSTDINGVAVDLAAYQGAVLITVYASDLSAGTAAWLVEESATGSGNWTTVTAAELVNPSTGEADTFTGASTSGAVEETLALKTEGTERYIRVTVDPTGATGSFAVVVSGQLRYA